MKNLFLILTAILIATNLLAQPEVIDGDVYVPESRRKQTTIKNYF